MMFLAQQMDEDLFNQLDDALRAEGPAAALSTLTGRLQEERQFGSLFYAMILRKRFELGISLLPTYPESISEPLRMELEKFARQSARLIMDLFLSAEDIPGAWPFAQMLEEYAPIAKALQEYQYRPEHDLQAVIDIAYHHGTDQRKGFDLILENLGICQAITTISVGQPPLPEQTRHYCVRRLVRALYQELCGRLLDDIESHEARRPSATMQDLLQDRPWLFRPDQAHIDVSHLAAVVQMALDLPDCEELLLAREMCRYGERLPVALRDGAEAPFEELYRDCGIYLEALTGINEANAIDHFERRLADSREKESTIRSAEVLVNLLLRLKRPSKALAVARDRLKQVDPRYTACPGLFELCIRAHDYRALAETAREHNDPVRFLAARLADYGAQGAPTP
jgi:hypothetical protein